MKLRHIFIILLIISVVVSFSYWFISKGSTKKQATTVQKEQKGLGNLIVDPQTPTDKVVVASVTLQKKGYLVVREIEGQQLSQIVEISSPLDKGTHKNVTISLGSADVKNKTLLVMIYDDYDSDSMFNDFDMPNLDENGFMTARYVNDGRPLPTTITEGESSQMTHNMPGMKSMVKVRYTDKGFVPKNIEVPQGSMVEFINESSKEMWVASAPHPSHTDLPTFDQFRPFKKGSMYRYVFDKKGTWKYHDHINASVGGVVKVTE